MNRLSELTDVSNSLGHCPDLICVQGGRVSYTTVSARCMARLSPCGHGDHVDTKGPNGPNELIFQMVGEYSLELVCVQSGRVSYTAFSARCIARLSPCGLDDHVATDGPNGPNELIIKIIRG